MKQSIRQATTIAAGALGIAGMLGVGAAIQSFLPRSLPVWDEEEPVNTRQQHASLPVVEIAFLRCASVAVPECIAVRGSFSFAPRRIAHSAVLVRHPQATFLYDTGLSKDIYLYLQNQSFYFKNTLARFNFEQSITSQLEKHALRPRDLDFIVVSHLHWDHVSGVPDLPDVPLHIARVEYEGARSHLLDMRQGLVLSLLNDNPIELFDCAGSSYENFSMSHDLFGDGSITLIPLPGHTAGNTGMLIQRANGSPLFLVGDAAWVLENVTRPATMHPFIWNGVTSDDATACQTLINLHHFSHNHPEIPLIAMHDAAAQEAFMRVENQKLRV